MSRRRQCPMCRALTLTVRPGAHGLYVMCRNLCPRERIVGLLDRHADALRQGGPAVKPLRIPLDDERIAFVHATPDAIRTALKRAHRDGRTDVYVGGRVSPIAAVTEALNQEHA